MIPSPRAIVRRDAGIYSLDRTLRRRGFELIAGVDEAGRGACAGPLVAAAVVLPAKVTLPVTDSKLLTAAAREELYTEVIGVAHAWSTVLIPPREIDDLGLHVCNVAALRQAVARLSMRPDYVLTDGFAVPGLAAPALAIWKGDQVSASVAAASIVAKVTRDRLMVELESMFPGYLFDRHKGYATAEHTDALRRLGPCSQHRFRYVNVRAALKEQAPRVTARQAGLLAGDPLRC